MRRDSRLSVALHTLLHMGQLEGESAVLTSEAMGTMMGTNPVVARRTMAGLRDAGIVTSVKGHGGGWSLAKALDRVTLLDVYEALGAPALFSIGQHVENPECVVEKAVNRAVSVALEDAEALVRARLGAVTLASLGASFRQRGAHVKRAPKKKKAKKGTSHHG